MKVSDAIAEVRDDLLETAAMGIATDTRVVRALNEGISYLWNRISAEDPDGQWLAQEYTYVYPAGTRWALTTDWTIVRAHLDPDTPGFTNRIISLVDLSGGANNPMPIEFVDPRSQNLGRSVGVRGRYQAVLESRRIGLRQAGTDTPPVAAVSTRLVAIPEPALIDMTELNWEDLVIGDDIPLPSNFAPVVVAYADVRLTMSTEAPSNDFQNRYNMLEATLMDMVRQHRKQTFTSPVVQIDNPWWC